MVIEYVELTRSQWTAIIDTKELLKRLNWSIDTESFSEDIKTVILDYIEPKWKVFGRKDCFSDFFYLNTDNNAITREHPLLFLNNNYQEFSDQYHIIEILLNLKADEFKNVEFDEKALLILKSQIILKLTHEILNNTRFDIPKEFDNELRTQEIIAKRRIELEQIMIDFEKEQYERESQSLKKYQQGIKNRKKIELEKYEKEIEEMEEMHKEEIMLLNEKYQHEIISTEKMMKTRLDLLKLKISNNGRRLNCQKHEEFSPVLVYQQVSGFEVQSKRIYLNISIPFHISCSFSCNFSHYLVSLFDFYPLSSQDDDNTETECSQLSEKTDDQSIMLIKNQTHILTESASLSMKDVRDLIQYYKRVIEKQNKCIEQIVDSYQF